VRLLAGVGERNEEALGNLGIRTLGDLLHHYPARWVDRRQIRSMADLPAILFGGSPSGPLWGEASGSGRPVVTVLGVVVGSRQAGPPGRRRGRGAPRRLEVTVRDESGSCRLVFFGGAWRASHFVPGAPLLVSGPLSDFYGKVQFQNPEYEILGGEEETAFHTGRLFPVYPLTKGLTQRRLRGWVAAALDRFDRAGEETLPEDLRKRYRLPPLKEALREIHFPPSPLRRAAARRRLAFEELFLDQLFMGALRRRRDEGRKGRRVLVGGPAHRRIRAGLPFRLTSDQEAALKEILDDLSGGHPMNRLLQGDVGSGKTVVALLAIAAVADTGLQAAFMAPTEILAEQHYRTLRTLAAPFGLDPRLLTGSLSAAARKEVLRSYADGSCPIAVGTHALFQKSVRFFDLGLVIVDEQHRFGVLQRLALWEKGDTPHVLVMSATPIPRSLALVRYADLDLSVIRERPAGRGKVVTRVTGEENREAVYAFLADRLREGRQAFVVYPLVEESAKSDLSAATTMAEVLRKHPRFAEFSVGLLHGQMRSEEKDEVMRSFLDGRCRILVATTVIEVGIDVPNASFLIVEHPERYGLSQLHQLRGRIGRGKHKSYCVLLAGPGVDGDARRRLEIFARTDDGFRLAEMDLQLRGQGDVGGTRQSGRPAYRLADPIADAAMVREARVRAKEALESGSLESGGEWEPLRRQVRAMLEASVAEAG